jgi:uncharacterized membrane protein
VKSMKMGEYSRHDAESLNYKRGITFLIKFLLFLSSRSAVCTCPSGYMGEHCEYRVDIHDDPFQSSHQIEHKGAGLFGLLEIMLIAFAVIVGVVVIFIFRVFGQTSTSREPTGNKTESDTSSCRDDIVLDNINVESNREEEDHRRCRGFSAVELL